MAVLDKVEKYVNQENKYVKLLTISAIIIGSALAVINGIQFVVSYIWKPTIAIVSIDFDSAVAVLNINGTQKTLYGNSTLAAGGDYGVQFGTTGAETETYDTLQLVKNGLVYNVIKTKN